MRAGGTGLFGLRPESQLAAAFRISFARFSSAFSFFNASSPGAVHHLLPRHRARITQPPATARATTMPTASTRPRPEPVPLTGAAAAAATTPAPAQAAAASAHTRAVPRPHRHGHVSLITR
ncbi:hypothetical protein CFP59_00366 [Streptomyces malaysiensis subsp. malaysiensis]|nr:hypothetical protein CFP59_00366 [Streptomyces sp. M56]